MSREDEKRQVRRAPVIASVVALVLVVIKMVVGFLSGATVLIASAADSLLDSLVSLFNYIAIRNAQMPSDATFNYGRGKIKAIASLFEGLIIAFSSCVIVVAAILKMIDGSPIQHTTAAIAVMGISALLTGFLVMYLDRVARKSGDLVVKTDALHYKVDLWTNLGILVALFLIYATGWHWLDPVISLGIAAMIYKEAWSIMREGFFMLMDRALDEDLVSRIQKVINHTNSRVNGHHLLRTRRSGDINFVEFHLVFDRDISLVDAHQISEQIETEIRTLSSAEWVINCHLDPVDDSKVNIQALPV